MSEHAKGPWVVAVFENRAANSTPVYSIEGPEGSEDYGTIAENVRSAAEARLIAAAPKMYDALGEIAEGVQDRPELLAVINAALDEADNY